MTFEEIEQLIEDSQSPVDNEAMEKLNRESPEGTQPYFRFLYNLAKYMKAGLCMEIGIYNGEGSKHLAAASTFTIGIDIQYTVEGDNITSILADSTDKNTLLEVKKYVKKYGKIDIVYQDSSHHYIPSIEEWDFYSPLMAKGGVWICDDITPAFYNPDPSQQPRDIDPIGCGMVQYFNSRPMENKKVYPDVLHKGNAQGIILF